MPRTWISLAFAMLVSGMASAAENGAGNDPVAAAAEAGGVAGPDKIAEPRDERFIRNGKKPLPLPTPRPPRSPTDGIGWGWFLRVMLYLCALAVVAWGALALARRYLPAGRSLFSSPALEILGRTNLDPRRYVTLIRVGRRIIVVGVGPEQVSTLAAIDNPEEIAEILAQAKPRAAAGKNLFQRLFAKHLTRVDHEARQTQTLASIEKLTADLTELRQRVRTLRETE